MLCAREALLILALYRLLPPSAHLRVCGGRGLVFRARGGAAQRESAPPAPSG